MIRGRLPAEEGALLMAALQAGRDQLRSAASDARRPGGIARLGGATRLRQLDLGNEPVRGDADGGRTREVARAVQPRRAALDGRHPARVRRRGTERRRALPGRRARRHRGPCPAPRTRRRPRSAGSSTARCSTRRLPGRLACDAGVVSILQRGGRPLSVGRKTRSVPPALRRALANRDQGCCFPGCAQTRFLHAHHIEHWARGGQTELANLVQLCAYHHRLIHEGGYRLTRGPNQTLIFTASRRPPDTRCPRPQRGHPWAATCRQPPARTGPHLRHDKTRVGRQSPGPGTRDRRPSYGPIRG